MPAKVEPAVEVNDSAVEIGMEAEAFKSNIETVELSDLGRNLPVGVWLNDERLTEVTLKPLTAKDERELGVLQKSANGPQALELITNFMTRAVSHIGGVETKEIARTLGFMAGTTPDVKRLFSSMYMGDVLSLTAIVKLATTGGDVAMAAKCPNCGHENVDKPGDSRHIHSIEGLEISCWKSDEKPILRHTLEQPVEMGEHSITYFCLSPLKYYQLNKVTGAKAKQAIDVEMLFSAITYVDHPAFQNMRGQVFTSSIYDLLSFPDLTRLKTALNQLELMPVFRGEMVCENCSHEWQADIPWADLRNFLFNVTAVTA